MSKKLTLNGRTKIIRSFLTNLCIVYKQPVDSWILAEMTKEFLKRNGLSAKLLYEMVKAPVHWVHYSPDANITIRSIQTPPNLTLHHALVEARIIDLSTKANIIDLPTYERACIKLPLICPLFTNLKEIRWFIGESIEKTSDTLMNDNQKFFIHTDRDKLDFSNHPASDVIETTTSQSCKIETQPVQEEERLMMANPADMQHSEVFIKFEDRPCKKILFTDFDGILSSGYIRSSNGSISKTINYGNKTAVNLAREMGYRVICITASNNMESVQISKDVCKDCKFDAFYLVHNPELKLPVIQSLAMKYNIPPENCVYIGDDFHDSEIFPKIGRAFAPVTSKEILLNEPDMWLYSNQPFLEAIYNIKLINE